jgi:nitrite reductase/ring-hydroxylating ferredoxin subunit
MSTNRKQLCGLVELPEGGSRGFSVSTANGYLDIFLVHMNGQISAYVNSCPHTGGPLDWVPDQFLNLEGDLIQCATHDALFRIHDGVCVAGPCTGQSLTPVPVAVLDDRVYLLLDELCSQ